MKKWKIIKKLINENSDSIVWETDDEEEYIYEEVD